MATRKTGTTSPQTSMSEALGSDLATAYTSRMAERVERAGLLSEGQRTVLKIEEKTDAQIRVDGRGSQAPTA